MKLSFWQSWVRVALQKYVPLQAKVQYNKKIGNELLTFARLSIRLVIEVGFVCKVGFNTRNRHNFGVIWLGEKKNRPKKKLGTKDVRLINLFVVCRIKKGLIKL